jgi:flavorubredoxin
MPKALIICASRAGETTSIGNLIAEGVRISGAEAEVTDCKKIKTESDLEGYDAVVLGSATYHGDMMQGMKTLLFLAEKASLKGVVGGAFGAFGWSGEAPDRIYDTMKNIFDMDMVNEPLRLKSSFMGGGKKMAHAYGGNLATKMAG